jgi:MFS family permease
VRQVIVIFMGLNCALFCSLLEQTIVTTALPTLGKVFNQAAISSWVGTAYMLTSTALQPVYGRLSDIFGRKSVLLGSLVIFMLGSLACALSTSMIMLIIFRAIQGIGGGGILTLALIISELTTTACA